jgi:hypothetical protein
MLVLLASCSVSIETNGENNQYHSDTLSEKENKDFLSQDIYLPIGTVVKLENHEPEVMIIGILQEESSTPGVLFDYSGVDYPIGLVDPKKNYLFNKNQITKIVFLGYWDETQDVLQEKIKETLAEEQATKE